MTLPYFLKFNTLNSFYLFNRHQVAFVFQHRCGNESAMIIYDFKKYGSNNIARSCEAWTCTKSFCIDKNLLFEVWNIYLNYFQMCTKFWSNFYSRVFPYIMHLIYMHAIPNNNFARLLFFFLNINYTFLRIL